MGNTFVGLVLLHVRLTYFGFTRSTFAAELKGENRMRDYSDVELAELADYAEEKERTAMSTEMKRAANAIRQGIDWMLRARVKERESALKSAGKSDVRVERPQ